MRLGRLLCIVGLISGCTVGPHYARPDVSTPIPPAYKEAADTPQGNSQWKPADPSDQIPRGKWWQVFQDTRLNDLEEQIAVSNQNLKIAEAQFTQARAAIRINRADYYPQGSAGLGITQNHGSKNIPTGDYNYTAYSVPFDVSYEPDVWGRVKHNVEGSTATAQATAADLETVNLSVHAELALDYFQLRGLDAEKQLLDSTVATYEKALELTQNRFKGGIVSESDVAQAQTQLETVRAQAVDVKENRALLEHAIALLIGKSASSFSIPQDPLKNPPPGISAGMPSELLERRPDIAGAERRMAAANAQIGVARTAFFPSFLFAIATGFEGGSPVNWLSASSTLWSVGPSAALTLFDGGRRHAISDQAEAVYQQTIASYQQTVLVAFEEVENSLASLRILQEEAEKQDAAVAAAEHSLLVSNNRYKGGVTTYLEVTTAQGIALVDERVAVELLSRRMVSSVELIKALGGGWKLSDLPTN